MKRFKIASNRRLRVLLLLLVALVGTGLWVAAYSTHLLRSLELLRSKHATRPRRKHANVPL